MEQLFQHLSVVAARLAYLKFFDAMGSLAEAHDCNRRTRHRIAAHGCRDGRLAPAERRCIPRPVFTGRSVVGHVTLHVEASPARKYPEQGGFLVVTQILI
jgi:hypothetical protein